MNLLLPFSYLIRSETLVAWVEVVKIPTLRLHWGLTLLMNCLTSCLLSFDLTEALRLFMLKLACCLANFVRLPSTEMAGLLLFLRSWLIKDKILSEINCSSLNSVLIELSAAERMVADRRRKLKIVNFIVLIYL